MSTDTEWERWGKKDPYFAVLTHDRFRSRNLTNQAKSEFFESGSGDLDRVLKVCREHLDHDFTPRKALDFGCGPGRLVIPLAGIAEHVVGLDVSESMLKEAHKNCAKYSVENVRLLKSDDNLSSLDECFDFIYSCIVFQHIPVERGRRIFINLLNRLEAGGIGAIHFTYSKPIHAENPVVPPRASWQLFRNLKRLFRKAPLVAAQKSQDPEMQMNPYNVNELLLAMQKVGIRNFHIEFTDHGGELGIFLYFQKPKST